MVDRVDKTEHLEHWRVQASLEAQKDKDQDEGEEHSSSDRDSFSGLHERTDWNLLLNKSKLWKSNIQVKRDEVKEILFKKINLKSDPSLLRTDIILHSGVSISPAFIAVSRPTGLKIKNILMDTPIPLDSLFNNNLLYITVPANPQLFAEEERRMQQQGIPRTEASQPITDEETTGSSEDLTIKHPAHEKKASWLGLRDPETKHFRPEVILVYGIPLLFIILCLWSFFYLF